MYLFVQHFYLFREFAPLCLDAFGKVAELCCAIQAFALLLYWNSRHIYISDIFIGRSAMRCHLNVMYFVTRVAAMNVPGICVPDGWLKS